MRLPMVKQTLMQNFLLSNNANNQLPQECRVAKACGRSATKNVNVYYPTIGGCVWKTDETDNATAIAPVTTNDDEFKIYPVPSIDKTITIFNPNTTAVFLKIYDLSGREVFTHLAEQGSFEVNLTGLESGMYLAHYNIGEQQKTKRIVLQ